MQKDKGLAWKADDIESLNYIEELLNGLCRVPSVSGFEDMEAEKMISLLSPLFDKWEKNKTGSFIFSKLSKKANAPVLMIDAHFDEIGFMVTKVCGEGFLAFSAVGGIDTRILPGADVTVFGRENINGVISSRPPHLMTKEEANQNPDIEQLYIDTGRSDSWLRENVPPGTPAAFRYAPVKLLNNRIAAAGLDNKACVAAAACAVKMLNDSAPADIYLVLSSREELGGMGAFTAANAILPDAALVLDVNLAFMPENPASDAEMLRRTVKIGEGASVSLSAVTDRALTRRLIRTAEENGVRYQTVTEASSTGTDADRLSLAGVGIPTAVMSIPLNNMHTYSEVISLDDILDASKLLCAFIRQMG